MGEPQTLYAVNFLYVDMTGQEMAFKIGIADLVRK
jgi:hypothetical protein